MASIGMLGFIKGASRTGLDMIERREEEEREARKEERLTKLRQEQMKYELEFKEENAIVDSPYDPVAKTVSNVTASGRVKSSRAARADENSSYEAGQEEARRKQAKEDADLRYRDAQISSIGVRDGLDAQRTASQISRNAAAEANYRKGGSSKRGLDSPAKPATDAERAAELAYQYKDVVDEAVATGNISRGAVQQAAIKVVENSPSGEAARESFLNFLSDYKAGRKKTAQTTRVPASSKKSPWSK